jgi:hypothetical protein
MNQDLPFLDLHIFPGGRDDQIAHLKRFQFFTGLPGLVV